MELYRTLLKFRHQVLTHAMLLTILEEYKHPNEKIGKLVKDGYLIRLKRSVYILGERFENNMVSKELVANLLYGPSYVSLEYALSYYGLIPERAYEVTSVTTRLKKIYETPIGCFSYIKSPPSLYRIGLNNYLGKELSYLIATPEKALCDKIIFTKYLSLKTLKDMQIFLEEDLRIELEELKDFDLGIIKECAENTPIRSKSIYLLHQFLEGIL